MALLDYDYIVKYKAKVRLMGPLHIGGALEGIESVLVHPVTARPFVQASGIAGVFRAYFTQQNEDESLVNEFFGSADEENTSRVRFADGEFEDEEFEKGVAIELRPHVMIDRQTGTVASSGNSGQKQDLVRYMSIDKKDYQKRQNSKGPLPTIWEVLSCQREKEELEDNQDYIAVITKYQGKKVFFRVDSYYYNTSIDNIENIRSDDPGICRKAKRKKRKGAYRE